MSPHTPRAVQNVAARLGGAHRAEVAYQSSYDVVAARAHVSSAERLRQRRGRTDVMGKIPPTRSHSRRPPAAAMRATSSGDNYMDLRYESRLQSLHGCVSEVMCHI